MKLFFKKMLKENMLLDLKYNWREYYYWGFVIEINTFLSFRKNPISKKH